jgi:hypothetical protein
MQTEERLQWVLAQVNDWLKFAEAKNGALVLLNGAAIVGAIQVATSAQSLNIFGMWYLISLCGLLSSGALVALFSFLPATEIPLLLPKEPPAPHDNLIFFGHVKKYAPDSYLQVALSREPENNYAQQGWLMDLAAQIVINSRIAVWKYACFKLALWLTIAAVVTPILGVVAFFAFWVGRGRWQRVQHRPRANLVTNDDADQPSPTSDDKKSKHGAVAPGRRQATP